MSKIDVCFPISYNAGASVPIDHGYLLYSAICACIPSLHDENIFVHLIHGKHDHRVNRLFLNPYSEIRIRIPADRVHLLLPLMRGSMQVEVASIWPKIPYTREIIGSNNLYVPWVMINISRKNKDTGKGFGELFKQALECRIPERSSYKILRKRVGAVKGKKLFGYDIFLEDLTDEQSVLLQENGLGGRCSMGCGIPVVPKFPDRNASGEVVQDPQGSLAKPVSI